MRILRSVGMAIALALGVSTCATETPPEPGTDGPVTKVLLTDAPFPYDRVARVDLWVVSVSASISPDTSATAQFVTLATPNRRINLMALTNGITDELGARPAPTGAVTAVRMVIDTDSSSITLKDGRVLTGKTSPGIQWQSSAGRPTLNALIHEQITIPDTGAVIVIDYDIGQAFFPAEDVTPPGPAGSFIFSPVLRAADARRTGAVAGTVRAQSGTGAPVVDASLRLYVGNPTSPENNWAVVGTARTDAAGAFRFSYATPSAYWQSVQGGWTYKVAVDPPSGSGLSRRVVANVSVSSGAETNVGAIVLP